MTAIIVAFPLVRRCRWIARLRQSKPGEFRHYLRMQVRMLERAGISEEEIAHQLRAVIAAAQLGGPPNRTGGVA
jgi:hypothetical protein